MPTKIKFPKTVEKFMVKNGSRIVSNVEPKDIYQFPTEFYSKNVDGTYTPLDYSTLDGYMKLVVKNHFKYEIDRINGK